jgi:cell division protein FtsI (penicillin-binding protein 3)
MPKRPAPKPTGARRPTAHRPVEPVRPGLTRNGRAPRPRAAVRRVLRPRADPGRRLGVTLLAIAFVLSLFAGRLIQLQGFDSRTYLQLAQNQRLQGENIPAVRGTITAANGQPLALTVQTYLVYADPVMMSTAQMPRIAADLAGPLGMTGADILSLLQNPTSTQYVVLKKGVAQQAADEIKALTLPGATGTSAGTSTSSGMTVGTALPGIAMQASYARIYPDGGAASNLLGFTQATAAGNLAGAAGLEYADNALLAGKPGSEQFQAGANGEQIPLAAARNTPAVNGSGLRLTIIPALQWEAQQACQLEVTKSRADNCTVVVMQPGTGKILALAQWPAYDPASANPEATSNLAVQNIFEPGSTAKVITAAAAMETGGQTITSTYTVPDAINIGDFTFHDAEYHPVERWTIAGILAHSSNDGMVQVVGHVPPQTQYDYLRAFGLDAPTGVNLPGESIGLLPAPSAWWGNERYTLSFGQGVDVTALQMASVYSTIANGGVRVQPTLVQGTTSNAGRYTPAPASPSRRVIQASTARSLIGALQQVPGVDAAGGEPWGVIPGYAVAAKTGTSQEWDAAKKCLCQYGSSWIGMAPGDNPQLVVSVNVQNPKKNGYFGAVVAGPVFYQVMKFGLQTMKIPPDGAKPADVPLTRP